MKRQKANSLENINWSELGKQNIQAKKVYTWAVCWLCHRRGDKSSLSRARTYSHSLCRWNSRYNWTCNALWIYWKCEKYHQEVQRQRDNKLNNILCETKRWKFEFNVTSTWNQVMIKVNLVPTRPRQALMCMTSPRTSHYACRLQVSSAHWNSANWPRDESERRG